MHTVTIQLNDEQYARALALKTPEQGGTMGTEYDRIYQVALEAVEEVGTGSFGEEQARIIAYQAIEKEATEGLLNKLLEAL